MAVETAPFSKSCRIWITARSPQRPEELPIDDLYVPGHVYRSVYLATDMEGVDNFNVLPLRLGDLDCYSKNNVKYIAEALAKRDRELIPSIYNAWADYWYGDRLEILEDFINISKYADLPLHLGCLRLNYPEGGYRNSYPGMDQDMSFNENGEAVWMMDQKYLVATHAGASFLSPFTFQLFADFNLQDPYSWQRTAHRLSSGWVVFEFHNVSKEYDTFLKDLYESGYDDVFGDLTKGIFSQSGVHSNISGGVGIFGSECVTASLR